MFPSRPRLHRLRHLSRSLFYTLTACIAILASSPLQAQEQGQEEATLSSSIGGRFMLEDHNGQIVTDQHFQDRFMLITFGYTYCPDICPTNLVNMAAALEALGDRAEKIAPIFITIDPARDTAAKLREYVAAFDDRIIGLTGPQPMIDSVSKRYKIVAAVHKPENWKDGDYLVDHTASIFLMAPDGKFLVKFAHGMPPEDMAKRIADFM
ncbi:SCO family protein [Magnetovibrio sp.]|uniref:SCO family protein n=1 Tax=Magnetovibrio sp. TaxID=2024836 RepID=UPI002F91FA41